MYSSSCCMSELLNALIFCLILFSTDLNFKIRAFTAKLGFPNYGQDVSVHV